MRTGALLAGLLSCACVPKGPRALSSTEWALQQGQPLTAPFDEVFDAAWLTLEEEGETIREHDRRAGGFETNLRRVEVGADGAQVVLKQTPHDRVFSETFETRWFERVKWLTTQWRTHPELTFKSRRGEVVAAGVHLLTPPGWEHFDFSTDRRTLFVQRYKGRAPGFNDTLAFRIERRAPVPDRDRLLVNALEKAKPGSLPVALEGLDAEAADGAGEHGTAQWVVGSSRLPFDARWRRWEHVGAAWVARLAAACPAGADSPCDADAKAVIEGAVTREF